LETVIAVMVFALVGVAVLAGLSTAYTSGSKTEVQSVAENLARNQVESIFSGPYREPQQTPYPTMTGIPTGYSIGTAVDFKNAATPTPYPDPEVEKISVTARYEGRDILTLETLRGRDDGLQLRHSPSADRSGSARLHGATISDAVYVFLDDPELIGDNQVDFYLDGVFRQTDNFLHWDFNGTSGALITDPAITWDTTTDPAANNGAHTITARTLLNDGNTVNVTADFIISN
jgi:type II secretory pathway pseudopilin PulG